MLLRIATVLALAAALPAPQARAQASVADLQLFSVGSGDMAGTYYTVAREICELINRQPDRGRLRCSPEPTQGSIYNLAMVRIGEMEFAFAQSDLQSAAYNGTSAFADIGPQENLRSVMSLYPETVTILAGADSGIVRGADIIGKRVDIGLPSSGRHGTVLELLDRIELQPTAFDQLIELSPTSAVSELCNGRIDAMFLVVGHPNALVADAMDRCDARLVSLDGPQMRNALSQSEDFQPHTIPAQTYPSQSDPVNSWAVYATVVTPAATPDREVAAMVRAVLDNLPLLGRKVPVLAPLDQEQMQTRALTAPLHPAAERAYADTSSR